MIKPSSPETTIIDGTPYSLQFDDIYFSPIDGVGESVYNFIDGNHLTTRFNDKQLTHFTIAETGFGTGLNFFLTVQHWQQYAPDNARLHFISVEKYPLSLTQLNEIYHDNPIYYNAQQLTQQLLASYPNDNTGNYQLIFENTTLTLLFGDAAEQLQQTEFITDAWFLDGFAPSKNPKMWSDQLFSAMANHSVSGTTFATFTAASAVSKGLQAAGFTVNKAKGFGRKRERLLGFY